MTRCIPLIRAVLNQTLLPRVALDPTPIPPWLRLAALAMLLSLGGGLRAQETPTLPTEQPMDTAQIYVAVQSSVVLIQTETGLGAGFVVKNRRLVATAHHVIEEGGVITVISRSGAEYDATPFAWKEEDDLALLELDRDFEEAAPLPLRIGLPLGVGMPVVMVGHPYGDYAESYDDLEGLLTWTITSGIVGGISARFIQTDAASSPGNSGGPIFDMHGRVVGVVSARLDGAEGLTFSVPVEKLQSLIDNPGQRRPLVPKPVSRFGVGLSRFSTEQDLWVDGVFAAYDRSPRTFGVRWGASVGYNRVNRLPENSTLFNFSEDLYWAQGEVGLRLFSPFGWGSLDPFLGVRSGWFERETVRIAANLDDDECEFDGSTPCELQITFDDRGSERGPVAMGVVGAAWNGPLASLGVEAFFDLLQSPRLRLGAFASVWF